MRDYLIEKINDLEKTSSEINTSLESLKSDFDGLKKSMNSENERPPFTINSLLKLCWGLSLNLSDSSSQQKLGEKFSDTILDLWNRNSPEKPDPSNLITKNQQIKLEFVQNLTLRLTSTVRNIGFVRDAHNRVLEEYETQYKTKKAFYDSISELSSTNKEGILAKLATFVGGGSITTLIPNLKEIFGEGSTKFNQYETLYGLTNDTDKKIEIFETMQTLVAEETVTFTATDLGLFIVAGVGLSIIISLLVKWKKDGKLKSLRSKKTKAQQEYWEKGFKPETAEYVAQFHNDVISLLEFYYPEKTDEMKKEFAKEVTGNPQKTLSIEEIKKYVELAILPHYWIYHDDFEKIS